MTVFEVVAAFLALVAIARWGNSRWLGLPAEVAVVLAALAAAAVLLVAQPSGDLPRETADFLSALRRLDFPQNLMGWLLAILLFAGAMQVDLGEPLRRYSSSLYSADRKHATPLALLAACREADHAWNWGVPLGRN